MTAKQCYDLLAALRTQHLHIAHRMEMYEAHLLDTPHINQQLAQMNVNNLRSQAKWARLEVLPMMQKLEEILRRDEEVNGWKGEDRELKYTQMTNLK